MRAQREKKLPFKHAAVGESPEDKKLPCSTCSGCAYKKTQINKKLPVKTHTVAGGSTQIKAFSIDAKGLTYHVRPCDAVMLFCEVRW